MWMLLFLVGCSGCGQEKQTQIWPTLGTHPEIQKIVPSAKGAGEAALIVSNNELYKISFPRDSQTGISVGVLKWNGNSLDLIHEEPWQYGFATAFVDNGRLFLFGTMTSGAGSNSIFKQEMNTTTWELIGNAEIVYTSPDGVTIYNTSVTKGPQGFVMMYECTCAQNFSERFLISNDLETWTPIGGLANAGYYSGGPFLIYVSNDWYILSYLRRTVGGWETVVARTQDFITFETSDIPFMGVDSPSEGINLSDVDFIEYQGKVYFTYAYGDQATWGGAGMALFDGTLQEFYSLYWN